MYRFPDVASADDPAGGALSSESSGILPPAPLTEAPHPPPRSQPPYTNSAVRVACVMRNYMHTPDAPASTGTPCKATMEVTRREGCKWVVTNLICDHVHSLDPPLDANTNANPEVIAPAAGMEFDSVAEAELFYSSYARRSGFSFMAWPKDNGMLSMQRFLCARGNHNPFKSHQDGKRGIFRKQASQEEDKAREVVGVESNEVSNEPVGNPALSMVGKLGTGSRENTSGLVGKLPSTGSPGQSRLLRELGVRVSRYTNEERKNIIMKYMKKRSNRQVVDRSIKVPSRQALAERRQRGVGGKFLSKEDTQNSNTKEVQEEESDVPMEDVTNAGGVPIVGMVFEDEGRAYEYFVNYAGNVGFSVKKGWLDRSTKSSTKSRAYMCSKERTCSKNSTSEPKNSRADARTGCPARMVIKATSSHKYRVTEFVSDHNHQLATPLDIQMLKSQRLLIKHQINALPNTSPIPAEYRNYLHSKRTKDMQSGDVGAILEYFQNMKCKNPSFYYAIQVDEDDQMTNVFWADAKSIMDYYYFGDVVCFDMAWEVHEYERPFALFLGINNHKQIIVFGAAFLYDRSEESLSWLFDTFESAMSGRQPQTILTDRCAAISEVISSVWPSASHRLSLWYIYRCANKQLSHVFHGSESFIHDFGQCVYETEEDEFLSVWDVMLGKYDLKDNQWLSELYEIRETWALPYGRESFCAEMESVLRNESLNIDLKDHLGLEKNLSEFLREFERLVEERRHAELQADYHTSQINHRIMPPLRILWHAATVYTVAAFEMFKREFELFVDCMVYACGEVGTLSEYEVVREKGKGHIVRIDSLDGTVTCTCKKFEFAGIQCCHVLKVLDIRNIKDLPPHYFLKRWSKAAKTGNVSDNHDSTLDGDPKSGIAKRYNSLCSIFYKIAGRAAENPETFTLIVDQLGRLIEQVERILQTKLLEKTSIYISSGLAQNLMDSGTKYSNNNEHQAMCGKKNRDRNVRRRPQNAEVPSKRQKGRRVQCDDTVAIVDNENSVFPSCIPSSPRNSSGQLFGPSHYIQGPYITSHPFVPGMQGYHHALAQYSQDASSSALHPQHHFHQHQPQQQLDSSIHMGQNTMQAYPGTTIHSLQYAARNPQLDHHSGGQGHPPVPVWAFL